MIYRYKSHQILDVVKAEKVLRHDRDLRFINYGDRGKGLRADLDLADGPLLDLWFRVAAGRFDDCTTFEAALILADKRIRGIGYSATARKRFYKDKIPKGWHQNICDPNLDTTDLDFNRHVALDEFEVTDLDDFLHKVCEQWHIALPQKGGLL